MSNDTGLVPSVANSDSVQWTIRMTETPRLVFAHGSGRAGADNWPLQAKLTTDAVFLTFPGYGQNLPRATNIDAWVHCILDACIGPSHIVAASYGGIAAIRAAAERPDLIRSLILFEPAAYSLARGQTNVEARIDRMSPIMGLAPHLSASDYFVKFIRALTDVEPSPPRADVEMTDAERLRLLAPPWSYSLPTHVFRDVPTLVVTGGWNQEYEEIAEAITLLGGEHRELLGHGHRVADHEKANELIMAWSRLHDGGEFNSEG